MAFARLIALGTALALATGSASASTVTVRTGNMTRVNSPASTKITPKIVIKNGQDSGRHKSELPTPNN